MSEVRVEPDAIASGKGNTSGSEMISRPVRLMVTSTRVSSETGSRRSFWQEVRISRKLKVESLKLRVVSFELKVESLELRVVS